MTKETMTREDMFELLPELRLVNDEELRNVCADVWIDALDAGGWFEKEGWGNFPFSVMLRDDCPENLLTHTGCVTKACLAVYESLEDMIKRVGYCDRDQLVAGALLHDVGKLLEYDLKDGKPCHSATAKKFRHPITGAYFAKIHDMDENIVHMVLTHSKYLSPEGDKAYCTPESWIMKVIDDMCYMLVDMFYGKNQPQE